MQNILDLQKELTIAVDKIRVRPVELNDVLDAIIAETIETKEELGVASYKTWKSKPFNPEALKTEAIDILFMVSDLFNRLGMDAEEVTEIYTNKFKKNMKRMEEGGDWNKR